MSEATTFPGLQRQAPSQPLACRLRLKTVIGRRGPIPNMAEVELENVSTAPLEIAHRMTVLQYLNLVATKADGSIASEGHFGDRFAPTLEPRVLRLEPGEKFSKRFDEKGVFTYYCVPHRDEGMKGTIVVK